MCRILLSSLSLCSTSSFRTRSVQLASIFLQLICAKISKETPKNRIHVSVSTGEHLTCNYFSRTALSLEVYSHSVIAVYPNFVTRVEQICELWCKICIRMINLFEFIRKFQCQYSRHKSDLNPKKPRDINAGTHTELRHPVYILSMRQSYSQNWNLIHRARTGRMLTYQHVEKRHAPRIFCGVEGWGGGVDPEAMCNLCLISIIMV
jgi:hypothetical protein